MSWECIKPEISLPDAAVQYKSGKRVEQYRVSDDALFMPKGRYLPLDCIEKLQIRKSFMPAGHCCGMGFPVFNLIVFYGAEKPLKLMMEKERNAVKLAGFIMERRKNVILEEVPAAAAACF